MKIIRTRLKPYGESTEFISLPNDMKSLIQENDNKLFHFLVEHDNVSTVKEYGVGSIDSDLVDSVIPVKNSNYVILFNENGVIEIDEDNVMLFESLPRQHTVDQWKMLRKMTKGIDIGDRISDLTKQGANIQYCRNAIDSGIESYEDFENHNKSFVPSWNLKHLKSPFQKKKKK